MSKGLDVLKDYAVCFVYDFDIPVLVLGGISMEDANVINADCAVGRGFDFNSGAIST